MMKGHFWFRTCLRVRWREGDAQGIVYYGSYMDYLEVAQAEYYRNLGFSIYRLAARSYFDTAVVKVSLEFRTPARVDDVLEIWVRVSHIGNASITSDFRVCPKGSDGLVAEGQIVYVGYAAHVGESRPIPEDIRRLIQHYEDTGEVLPLSEFPALADAAGGDTHGT